MKNIKELNLELIKLEDQVLLIDKNSKIEKGDLFEFDTLICIYDGTYHLGAGREHKIIASTKPLEGLPLLVIDYEIIGKPLDDYIKTKANQDQCIGFIEGYNKAKETFKFTEEDMVEFAMNMISQYQFGNTNIHNRGILMESLPKKELYVEVEYQDMMDMWVSPPTILEYCNSPMRVKITDNKIKAVWK